MWQRIFLLINPLIALYALEQGDEVEIEQETFKPPKNCTDWRLHNPKMIINNCGEGISCTFFFLKYNIATANEWFGNFEVVSRLQENKSFSRFEIRIRYDNMFEKEIYELPKNVPNTLGFHEDNEVINFSVDKGYKNLILGARGPDFCGSLSLTRLYYYKCPARTSVLVNFVSTPAPSKLFSPIVLQGNCAENAVQNKSNSLLSMKCYYNGSYEVFGNCVCKAGFSNLDNGSRNKKCTG